MSSCCRRQELIEVPNSDAGLSQRWLDRSSRASLSRPVHAARIVRAFTRCHDRQCCIRQHYQIGVMCAAAFDWTRFVMQCVGPAHASQAARRGDTAEPPLHSKHKWWKWRTRILCVCTCKVTTWIDDTRQACTCPRSSCWLARGHRAVVVATTGC